LTSHLPAPPNDYHPLTNHQYSERRKQKGVEKPTASDQPHILIIRLDLASQFNTVDDLRRSVRQGLKRLCGLFEKLATGKRRLDKLDEGILSRVPLDDFSFSATIGFGIGFFDKLNIPNSLRPRKITSMPNSLGLGDVARYSLAQTDMIVQLGSKSDFVNRWVLENAFESREDYNRRENSNEQDERDIVTAVREWAIITDVHIGFQRMDGRNLMGFYDGISNPRPNSGEKFNSVVWTTEADEGKILKDGTYMVFQKIEHDLDQWNTLSVAEQEQWVGRNKITGLLLGTPENDDEKFIQALRNDDLSAKQKLSRLLHEQGNPDRPFYDLDLYKKSVPVWSHVRKANPRQEKILNGKRINKRMIFRRGYLFLETGLNNRTISGLLFICFQRDIQNGFEFIKKNWLNNKNFPTPQHRPFDIHEMRKRRSQGRFTVGELERISRYDLPAKGLLGLDDYEILKAKIKETSDLDTQNTGREGLSGPSELGVTPVGDFMGAIPFGGGYYFIPPIPPQGIVNIGQQFFDKSS
jgi:Dyp-type peroxidase family